MKCHICGGKADMQTTTNLPICHSCAEKKGVYRVHRTWEGDRGRQVSM